MGNSTGATCSIFGCSSRDIVGRLLLLFVLWAEATFDTMLQHTRQKGEQPRGSGAAKTRSTHESGALQWSEDSCHLLHQGNGLVEILRLQLFSRS